MTPTGYPKLKHILAYVHSHGFKAYISGPVVQILIPYTRPDGSCGVIKESVSTFKDARVSLGY